MSVVISGSLVLGDTVSGGGVINADNPLIGYDNVTGTAGLSATSAAAGYPVTNLGNPLTHLRWLGVDDGSDQYVTIDLDTVDPLDYLGIARHNFHSAQIPVSIEGNTEAPEDPLVWQELAGPVIPPNDGPLMFRFTSQSLTSIRVRMQPGLAAPSMAVVYVGKLLVLQRRIFVGHTPINYGRSLRIANGRSEAGHFLGRIVLSEKRQTQVDLQNLTPAWFRSRFEPFLAAAETGPFFFAWRPAAYPYEVGFVWLTSDAQPSNQLANGMMSISLEITGVV